MLNCVHESRHQTDAVFEIRRPNIIEISSLNANADDDRGR